MPNFAGLACGFADWQTRRPPRIEEAVRWKIFHETVVDARAAFAEVPPGKLQKMIDEAVEEVRAQRYRERNGG